MCWPFAFLATLGLQKGGVQTLHKPRKKAHLIRGDGLIKSKEMQHILDNLNAMTLKSCHLLGWIILRDKPLVR